MYGIEPYLAMLVYLFLQDLGFLEFIMPFKSCFFWLYRILYSDAALSSLSVLSVDSADSAASSAAHRHRTGVKG